MHHYSGKRPYLCGLVRKFRHCFLVHILYFLLSIIHMAVNSMLVCPVQLWQRERAQYGEVQEREKRHSLSNVIQRSKNSNNLLIGNAP